MVPLSDHSWAMQFQSDDWDGQHPSVNIGWYWARPHPITYELLSRSEAFWNDTRSWDQYIVNVIRNRMLQEEKLSNKDSVVLSFGDYVRADVLDWQPVYLNPPAIDQLNLDSVMVHYTGFFGLMKSYLPKHFGHWVNETYYTQSVSLLQPLNVTGTLDELIEQMALAVYFAKSCERTFMWPIALHEIREQGYSEDRPAVAVVDEQSVANAVSWVEGTYLHNRARYSRFELSEQTIPVMFEGEDWINKMVMKCRSSKMDVVKIDFGNLNRAEVVKSEQMRNVLQEISLWAKTKTWL
jgi:hypothetical protein